MLETTEPIDELTFSHARLTEMGVPSHHDDGRELALWDRITLLLGADPQSLPVPSERSRPIQPVSLEFLRVALTGVNDWRGRPLVDEAVGYVSARIDFGERKYGRRLTTWNKRDPGLDAQQEAGDLPNYCAQAAMEHADEGDAEGAGLWSALGCEAALILGRIIHLRQRPVVRDSGVAAQDVPTVSDGLLEFVNRARGIPGLTEITLRMWSVRQTLEVIAGLFGIGANEPMMPAFRERARRLRELADREQAEFAAGAGEPR